MLDGLYDFHYTPYFIGVANALDDAAVSEVDLQKAAQIGWTYFLIGYLGKRVDTLPCPIIVLFAKERDGKKFHDEKLVKTIESTPALLERIDVSKARASGNRWDHKSFPGGFLILAASNSPGNLKSTSSVGVVVVEEPDDTATDVRGQGDAISNIEERLKRYPGRKLIVGGTPAVKDISKIEQRVKESDARVLPVRCHDCSEFHVLDWENVSWLSISDDETPHEVYGRAMPETAIYSCPHCGSTWDDYQRQKNVRETVFAAVAAGDRNAGWVPTRPFHGKAGFTDLSELYVCLPGTSLADVVKSFLEAEFLAERGDESKKITFVNQKLGKPYEYSTNTPDAEILKSRGEDYDELTVPRGGLVLTAGIDVQHDRLAVQIWAWGRGEEMWLVYWGELIAKGQTSDKTDPVWGDLDQLLFTPRESADGYSLICEASSIDSGDGMTSDTVYSYVRPRQSKNLMAAKGSSDDYGSREIFAAPRKIDHKKKGHKTKADKHGLQVHIVGTHKAKDLLFSDKGRITLRGNGPGRMHWYRDVRSDFYDQITAEVRVPSKRLRGKMEWQKKAGVRNEGTDCAVLATHAARALRVHTWTEAKWLEREKALKQADLFSAEDPPQQEQKQPQQSQSTKQASRNFVGVEDGEWIR